MNVLRAPINRMNHLKKNYRSQYPTLIYLSYCKRDSILWACHIIYFFITRNMWDLILLYNAKSCKDFAKYLSNKRVGLGPPNKLLHFHPFTKKETTIEYKE